MTHEEFEARVRALERSAEARPRAYRLRVVAWAALAYAYVLGILLLALASIGLLLGALVFSEGRAVWLKFAVKGGWALGALVIATGRALWVRLEPPEGLPLAAAEHPELFETIGSTARAPRSAASTRRWSPRSTGRASSSCPSCAGTGRASTP